MTVELNNQSNNNNQQQQQHNKKYRNIRRTKEMFDEIERKYRMRDGIKADESVEPKKLHYRQNIEMIYDALENCKHPTKRYMMLNSSVSNPRTQKLIKDLIVNELIKPAAQQGSWIRTEKGVNLYTELSMLFDRYPFIANKENHKRGKADSLFD